MLRKFSFAWLGVAMLMAHGAGSTGTEVKADTQALMSEGEASRFAVATLQKELAVDAKNILVVHLSRVDWPNSALGCPKPGLSYTQGVTAGYLALLSYDKQQYRVHIGNGRGLVCHSSRLTLQSSDVILSHLKTLAKEDLASRLGIDAGTIEVVEEKPTLWSEGEARCSNSDGQNESKRIRGYLLKLEAQNRIFEYRTSGARVLACPLIESE